MKSFLLLSLAACAISSGLATKPHPPDHAKVCNLPKAVGPCRARLPRFYYDSFTKSCLKFFYGGCGGNENNFKRRSACRRTCEAAKPNPPVDPPTDICKLPIVVGPCKAAFPSWGFENGECKSFTYGGCQGNENRFETKEACEAACDKPVDPSPSKDICTLPIVAGPCEALIKSWGFKNGACTEFNYGGCDGNENRFATKEECEKACGKSPPPYDVCSLPLVSGNCLAYFKRFGFKDGKCTEFIYGGCGANGNNFETVGECEQACGTKY